MHAHVSLSFPRLSTPAVDEDMASESDYLPSEMDQEESKHIESEKGENENDKYKNSQVSDRFCSDDVSHQSSHDDAHLPDVTSLFAHRILSANNINPPPLTMAEPQNTNEGFLDRKYSNKLFQSYLID